MIDPTDRTEAVTVSQGSFANDDTLRSSSSLDAGFAHSDLS